MGVLPAAEAWMRPSRRQVYQNPDSGEGRRCPPGSLRALQASGRVGETCYPPAMRTLSVRDLRQRWPEAEARLRVEREIVITRDSKPVAKLVRIDDKPKRRKRFDPVAHAKWQRRMGGGRVARWVDRALDEARRDRRPLRDQA